METSVDEFFFSQLAKAGSYWGLRYTDLQVCTYASGYVPQRFIRPASDHRKPYRSALLQLINERNKVSTEFRTHGGKLELRGNLGFQLIQIFASLMSSVIGGGILAVIVFVPLHILSNSAKSETYHSLRSFLVVDMKGIKGQAQIGGEESNSDETERPPPAPPSSPTNLRLEL